MPGSVYVLVMIVGGLFSLVSWGWLVLTAVLARQLAQRVDGVDYAYLIAHFAGAVVNFAIPSVGGEWAVIGPSLTETALVPM